MRRSGEHALPAPAPVALRGAAQATGDPLTSPASGGRCVHWRLRIFEAVGPGVELVHEVMAPEPFELRLAPEGPAPARKVRLTAERARIDAESVFHREGSAGALAVARHFGIVGRVRVEETLVREGDTLEASGVLFDPEAAGSGPYRGSFTPAELFEASVRVTAARPLRPPFLGWVLGTAAALLASLGAATLAARAVKRDRHVTLQGPPPTAEIGAAKVPRPRWP